MRELLVSPPVRRALTHVSQQAYAHGVSVQLYWMETMSICSAHPMHPSRTRSASN